MYLTDSSTAALNINLLFMNMEFAKVWRDRGYETDPTVFVRVMVSNDYWRL